MALVARRSLILASSVLTYRIYDPEKRKVLRSRDVKFQEDVFPLKKVIEDFWENPILPVRDTVEEASSKVQRSKENLPSLKEVVKNTEPVRRSERLKNLEDKYMKWKANCAYIENIEELVEEEQHAIAFRASFEMENRVVPNSYKQAMKLPDKQKWKTAIFEELDSLENNQVFEIIERSKIEKGKTLVGNRWVLTQKFNELGELKRYKARCVAQGFKQKEGIDYQETFSPTGRLSTLRYLIALAVETGEEIRQADFVTAYLNATLEEDETVYMNIPEGFKEWLVETKPETLRRENIDNFLKGGNDEYIMKLKKSLYGLKQSARSWYNTMASWLENKGFQISEADPCLFTNNGTILFVWVDEIIVIGPKKEELLNMLKKRF